MNEARRLHYLDAMGIRVWRLRSSAAAVVDALETDAAERVFAERQRVIAPEPPGASATSPSAPPANTAPYKAPPDSAAPPSVAPSIAGPPSAAPPGASPPAASDMPPTMDEPPPWTEEDMLGMPVHESLDALDDLPFDDAEPAPNPVASMDWPALKEAVAGCRACGLCERRRNTVFGVGDQNAALMFVGEAPGEEEDRKGEPFVGRAGQLLDRMLAAAGLKREQVYIANVVKCRPPGNRVPTPDEAAACRAYLHRQIVLVQPKLLVSLGGVSATNLLDTTESVGKLRGRTHAFGAGKTPLLVTYHPSYYLRSPAEKAKGWQDLQRIMRAMAQR